MESFEPELDLVRSGGAVDELDDEVDDDDRESEPAEAAERADFPAEDDPGDDGEPEGSDDAQSSIH
jgi:hypothetical protein